MENNLNQEIIEHLMHPRNYGTLENPSGVGVGHSEQNGEFVIFYIQSEGDILHSVTYATSGCHDTVVLGSMFTEMILGQSHEYTRSAALKLRDKAALGPVRQQACAQMVLTAFEAAQINEAHRFEGRDEEHYAIEIGMECEVKV